MTQSFAWPGSAAVLLDTAPPEVERITATYSGVEVLFSEPIDSATLPAAVTVDGQTLTWTAAGSEYRYCAAPTLPPGPHQVRVSTQLHDLAGTAPATTGNFPFSIPNAGGTLAYEKPDPDEIEASAAKNPYGFQRLPRDPETGVLYVRNRYFDPEIGRFITADPLGFVDGPSEYAFGGNGPVNGGDALGLLNDGDPMPDERARIAAHNRHELVRLELFCKYNSLAEECQSFIPAAIATMFGDFDSEVLPVSGQSSYPEAPIATAVNGVLNDRNSAMASARNLSYTFGVPVGPVWNVSHGLVRDSAQLVVNKLGILDSPTRALARTIRSRIAALPPNGLHIVFAHSQGAAIASSALSALSPAERSRIVLVTLGEATVTLPTGIHDTIRIANMLDPVPWLFGGNWGSSLLAGAWFTRPTVDRFWIGFEHPLDEYLENERKLEMICLSNSVEARFLYPANCSEGVGRSLIRTQGRSGVLTPIIRAGPQ